MNYKAKEIETVYQSSLRIRKSIGSLIGFLLGANGVVFLVSRFVAVGGSDSSSNDPNSFFISNDPNYFFIFSAGIIITVITGMILIQSRELNKRKGYLLLLENEKVLNPLNDNDLSRIIGEANIEYLQRIKAEYTVKKLVDVEFNHRIKIEPEGTIISKVVHKRLKNIGSEINLWEAVNSRKKNVWELWNNWTATDSRVMWDYIYPSEISQERNDPIKTWLIANKECLDNIFFDKIGNNKSTNLRSPPYFSRVEYHNFSFSYRNQSGNGAELGLKEVFHTQFLYPFFHRMTLRVLVGFLNTQARIVIDRINLIIPIQSSMKEKIPFRIFNKMMRGWDKKFIATSESNAGLVYLVAIVMITISLAKSRDQWMEKLLSLSCTNWDPIGVFMVLLSIVWILYARYVVLLVAGKRSVDYYFYTYMSFRARALNLLGFKPFYYALGFMRYVRHLVRCADLLNDCEKWRVKTRIKERFPSYYGTVNYFHFKRQSNLYRFFILFLASFSVGFSLLLFYSSNFYFAVPLLCSTLICFTGYTVCIAKRATCDEISAFNISSIMKNAYSAKSFTNPNFAKAVDPQFIDINTSNIENN